MKNPTVNMPRYQIVSETKHLVLIRDLGPWDKYPTVTNRAEEVAAELAPLLRGGRRLEYYDSSGNRDEIIVRDGCFAGFRAGNVTMNPT